MQTTRLRHWDTDREEICRQIAGRRSTLKILLKTKDEPELLAGWFEHHARIAGAENLVIGDNGSTMPEARELLLRLSETCSVFEFAGSHNDFHKPAAFPHLYAALGEAADCYVPVDTDERLYWIEDGTWRADHTIVDGIRAQVPFDIMPAALLNNVPEKDTSFILPADQSGWKTYLVWGKPVVRAGLDYGTLHRLHNCQFKSGSAVASGPLNLFCVHLTALNAELRLRSHIQKLVGRRIVPAGTSAEDAAEILKTIESEDLVVKRLKHEIAAILEYLKDPSRPYWKKFDPSQIVELLEDGSLGFGSDEARTALETMIREGADIVRAEMLTS